MMHTIYDRDGDAIEVEAKAELGVVYIDFPDDFYIGRALTRDQCAELIAAITEAAKELP